MPPVCVSLWAGVGLDSGLHTPHSFRIGAATTAASSVPAGTLQAKDGGCTGRYFTMGIRPPLFPGLRRTRKSGSAYNLISEISPRLLRTQPRWLPGASWASSDTYCCRGLSWLLVTQITHLTLLCQSNVDSNHCLVCPHVLSIILAFINFLFGMFPKRHVCVRQCFASLCPVQHPVCCWNPAGFRLWGARRCETSDIFILTCPCENGTSVSAGSEEVWHWQTG